MLSHAPEGWPHRALVQRIEMVIRFLLQAAHANPFTHSRIQAASAHFLAHDYLKNWPHAGMKLGGRLVLRAAPPATLAAFMWVAYKYRPRNSLDVDFHEKLVSSATAMLRPNTR